jgi:hypothetical protein
VVCREGTVVLEKDEEDEEERRGAEEIEAEVMEDVGDDVDSEDERKEVEGEGEEGKEELDEVGMGEDTDCTDDCVFADDKERDWDCAAEDKETEIWPEGTTSFSALS